MSLIASGSNIDGKALAGDTISYLSEIASSLGEGEKDDGKSQSGHNSSSSAHSEDAITQETTSALQSQV